MNLGCLWNKGRYRLARHRDEGRYKLGRHWAEMRYWTMEVIGMMSVTELRGIT